MSPGSGLSTWEGQPVDAWARAWAVPCVEAHQTLSSTNDRLRALAREGTEAFTVVIAEQQTAGRGRAGKHWESPARSGLWMSFLLRPRTAGDAGLTPILMGLAAVRGIEAVCPRLRPELKWPNDVLIAGQKVCGILSEGVGPDAIVVGVGVNVDQSEADFPSGLRARATSLRAAGCTSASRARLAGALLGEARALLEPLPARLAGTLLRELRNRDALAGRDVRADTGQEGRALGLGEDGGLLIEVAGTIHTIRGGGVRVI